MLILNLSYLLLSIYLGVIIFLQLKAVRINALLMINIFVLLYYALPFYLFTLPSGIYKMEYNQPTITGLFCVLFFYVSSMFGYNVIKERRYVKYRYYVKGEAEFTKRTAIMVTIFSVIVFLLFCSLYGGVSSVMMNIYAIRGGDIESGNKNLEFLVKLFIVVTYAPVLLIPFWNSGHNGKIDKKTIVIVTIIAFIIKLSYGSRGAFLSFFVILLVGSIVENKVRRQYDKSLKTSNKFNKYIIMAIISLFAIVMLRPLLAYLYYLNTEGESSALFMLQDELYGSGGRFSIGSSKDFIGSLLLSFDHYASSLEMSLDKVYSGIHKNNYFMEFFIMLQSVIPSLLLGITKMTTVTEYNTIYFNFVGIGNVPPGVIGSAIYAGGIFWIPVYGFLVGYIAKRLDIFYLRIRDTVHFANYYYVALLFLFLSFAASGDFASQFSKAFTSFILFLYIYTNFKRVKINEKINNVYAYRSL